MTRSLAGTLVALSLLVIAANADAAARGSQLVSAAPPTAAELRAGVRAALQANHELVIRVLWTNEVPTTASLSTRGPALAAMRASAKGRLQDHVRVRMLHDRYRIISIRVSRSETSATSIVQSDQNVRPSHLDGKPLGRAVTLNERARIVLHRIGSSRRFVVWTLTLLK